MKVYPFQVTTIVLLFVLSFLNAFAQKADSTASAPVQTINPAATGDWKTGENLFVGNIRFTNGGPACNSCHNVSIKGFVSGGALAKDLTQAVTRLTPDGAKAFFAGNPMPMPQMQQSFAGKPLTVQEVNDILAFLTYSDELAKNNPPVSTIGKRMLTGGIAGVMGLLILFSFFWIKRKQRPVNYRIFKRQIKSS